MVSINEDLKKRVKRAANFVLEQSPSGGFRVLTVAHAISRERLRISENEIRTLEPILHAFCFPVVDNLEADAEANFEQAQPYEIAMLRCAEPAEHSTPQSGFDLKVTEDSDGVRRILRKDLSAIGALKRGTRLFPPRTTFKIVSSNERELYRFNTTGSGLQENAFSDIVNANGNPVGFFASLEKHSDEEDPSVSQGILVVASFPEAARLNEKLLLLGAASVLAEETRRWSRKKSGCSWKGKGGYCTHSLLVSLVFAILIFPLILICVQF